MSSSRRSSRSVRSPKPPSWRSVTISKNSAATGLSYVFAEPEQGSPLAPAMSKLPAASSSRNVSDLDLDTVESSTRLRSRQASTSSVRSDTRGLQGSGSREDPVASTESPVVSSLSSQASTSTTSMPPPDPQSASEEEPTPTNSAPSIVVTSGDANLRLSEGLERAESTLPTTTPKKSSWFGSISRAKGRENAAKMDLRAVSSSQRLSAANVEPTGLPSTASPRSEVDPTPYDVSSQLSTPAPAPLLASAPPPAVEPPAPPVAASTAAPTTETPAPTPASISVPKDTTPPQPQTPPRRSWFSSSAQASPSAPAPRPELPGPQPSRAQSIPSSIDEEVPALTTVSPPASPLSSPSIVASPSIQSQNESVQGHASLSSLNPSTSRFMLSIPLLGRPKMPLETAVAVVQSEEAKTEPTNTTPYPTKTNDATTPVPAIQVTIVEPDPTASPAAAPMPDNEAPTPATAPVHITTCSVSLPPPASSPSQESLPIPSSSSWWSYVGWGPTVSTAPSSSEPDTQKHVHHHQDAAAPHGQDGAPSPPTMGDATTPMGLVMTHDEASVSASAIHPDVAPDVVDPSLTRPRPDAARTQRDGPGAGATANGQAKKDADGHIVDVSAVTNTHTHTVSATDDLTGAQGSSSASAAAAWYTPWAWYSSDSNVTPAPLAPAGTSSESGNGFGNGNGLGSGLGLQGRNGDAGEAEMNAAALGVQEAALGPGREVEAVAPKDGLEKRGDTGANGKEKGWEAAGDVNPVVETIAANRSGWASFFSSRALMVKSIADGPAGGGGVDENGMEVMDVDEESDAGAEEKTRAQDAGKAKGPEENTRGRDAGKAKNVGGGRKEGAKTLAERKVGASGEKATIAGKEAASITSSRASSVKRTGNETPPTVNKGLKPTAPPLTISESVKRETVKSGPATKKKDIPTKPETKSTSPSPSTKTPPLPRTPIPNLILPTWSDTFHTPPRSVVPPPPTSTFSKTIKFVSGVLFPSEKPEDLGTGRSKGKGREQEFLHFGKELPKAWDVVQEKVDLDVLRGCRRVVVIGIHGWFPGAVMRTVIGEPTGTSPKFVNMMVQALEEFQERHGVKLEQITKIPLEGEGTIEGRVAKLYATLQANQEWMDALHAADAVLIATHSQGSIVSTHLLDRLICDRHIRTSRNTVIEGASELFPTTGLAAPVLHPQRVCCLSLCGIHLGPLRYLNSSSLLQPYFQYFESAAARELFEFQNTESEVSKNYIAALRSIVDHGVKIVYVASLNDQVVPLYSGLFTAASHPLILRALYIDRDAYQSSDFLTNLLVLLLRILNSGISDSGLTVHLSEATAGSLSGVGHSTAYEELSTYSLAVRYLFLTNNGLEDQNPGLVLEPFNAATEQNDYEIPWALRDVIADERVAHFFSREIAELRDAFRDWHPKTSILRDLKRKLQPIQRLPASFTAPSSSKL